MENHEKIMSELSKEEQRFQRTLKNGMKEFDRVKDKAENGMIDGLTAFHLYDTFGFPVEFTQEMAKENGLQVDLEALRRPLTSIRRNPRLARNSGSRAA